MIKESPDITIRAASKGDSDFIFATWLRAYRYGSDFICTIPEGVYFKHQHDAIEVILRRSNVLVATPKDDLTLIVGYMCHQPEVIHFVYVKKPFRQMGIATELLRAAGLSSRATVTHWTKGAEPILAK